MVKGKFETAIPWAWIASGGVIEFSNLISGKNGFERRKNGHWCELIQGMGARRPDSECQTSRTKVVVWWDKKNQQRSLRRNFCT